MDPVRTEIMKNRFAAIAEEATMVAYRTAHTTFVKQTQDYQVAVANLNGEYFAHPLLSGVTLTACQSMRGFIEEIGLENFREGDIYITNDPYSADAMVTHIMDIHLVRPVFCDGKITCFAWAFIHASDVGGAVPGSIAPNLTEVFQEGIRLRPTLLYSQGTLRQDILNILKDNCRIPDQVWGDLRAMLAALALLDKRMNELTGRFGRDTVLESIDDVLQMTERRARQVFATLRDGSYEFHEYLEGRGESEFVFLHAKMTVAKGEIDLDFSGSDPQVLAAMNVTSGTRTHPLLCMPLVNFVYTMDPTIPANGGLIRPVKTHAPVGTVLNAEFPAAAGNRFVTVTRCHDLVLGCLNQAIPGGLCAVGASQAGIMVVSWLDDRSGRRKVAVAEPLIGGSGGRRSCDGADGTDMPVAFLRTAPIESVEAEMPVLMRRYGYTQDKVAPGTYRGGAAIVAELECLSDQMVITIRGLDRFRLEPWGAMGGYAGGNQTATINPGTAREQKLPRIEVLNLSKGDIFRAITPYGGGFGDPLQRVPERVARDVRDGLVSTEVAFAAYGVVMTDGQVDSDATQKERARRGTAAPVAVSAGPNRARLDRDLPPDWNARVARTALSMPPSTRLSYVAKERAARLKSDKVAS